MRRLVLALALVSIAGCAPPATAPQATTPQVDVIGAVRSAVARQDWPAADRIVREQLTPDDPRPDVLEALSWIGRGALADGQLDRAMIAARETERLTESVLERGTLAAEPHLATALGAAFEVQAQALAAQGNRSDAVHLLNGALERYGDTPIHARIQKNIHLLSLVGSSAPALDASEVLGDGPATPVAEGRPTLMFFWAHWCSDCKVQSPSIEQLRAEFGEQGLQVLAPTQRYGYAADASQDAGPSEERQHIAEVHRRHFGFLSADSVPLSGRNFTRYGVSSTPTLVLVDAAGIVQLYHPGMMPEPALYAAVAGVMTSAVAQ